MSNAARPDETKRGAVWSVLAANRTYFFLAAIFSFGLNILFLASPLYMLQVYDRVLASGSRPTLAMLTLALAVALITLSLLDDARSKILMRAGAKLDADLSGLVFAAQLRAARSRASALHAQAIRELDNLRGFIGGNGLHGIFDMPWLPVYLAVMYILHPILAAAAIICSLILLGLALANEILTRKAIREVNESTAKSHHQLEGILRNAEVVHAMGMGQSLRARWQETRNETQGVNIGVSDVSATVQSSIKFARIFMQSLMLGLGAWLVIEQQITAGAMFAASILLGRALAPVEQSVGVWKYFITARTSIQTLERLLANNPEPAPSMPLPRPRGKLSVQNLVLTPPNSENPIIRGIGFVVEAGETLAIVGPSGAGKSSLVRALTGVWKPRGGKVRLDSADVAEWNPEDRGPHIGYVPQEIELFGGTVRDNIARFGDADPAQIIAAARLAGIHEMILRLPKGYETEIGDGGAALSGGQRQRLALARALFGNPAFFVLDEPNSNLDSDGDEALRLLLIELKKHGRTVVLVSHRPQLLAAADKILVLRDGAIEQFGPRQEVLARLTQPAQRPAQAN